MPAISSYPTNASETREDSWAKRGSARKLSGIHRGVGQQFQVTQTPTPSLAVVVNTGAGAVFDIDGESASAMTFSLATASPTQSRIDRIVMSLNMSASPYVNNIELLTGTASASPQPPALRRTAQRFDIEIAQINVGAAASAIANAQIKMNRLWFPAVSEWEDWTPNIVGLSGSSSSVAEFDVQIARYRFNGSRVEIDFNGNVRLAGSTANSTGFRISLPSVAGMKNIPAPLTCPGFAATSVAAQASTVGSGFGIFIQAIDIPIPVTSTKQNIVITGSYESGG